MYGLKSQGRFSEKKLFFFWILSKWGEGGGSWPLSNLEFWRRKKSCKRCPNWGEGGERGNLDEIQKNNSYSSWDRPLMRGFFCWNYFLLQSMGTIRRGKLNNDMMSRGRSGRVLDDYYYHYLELSSFCLSHLNIMHFDLFAQRDFELPHFWSCRISGLARLFHIYPQNRANGYLDTWISILKLFMKFLMLSFCK